jgi:hypothetical protein
MKLFYKIVSLLHFVENLGRLLMKNECWFRTNSYIQNTTNSLSLLGCNFISDYLMSRAYSLLKIKWCENFIRGMVAEKFEIIIHSYNQCRVEGGLGFISQTTMSAKNHIHTQYIYDCIHRPVWLIKTVFFNSSSFTCFGQNNHLQKDIINTYGNYYYNVMDINIF